MAKYTFEIEDGDGNDSTQEVCALTYAQARKQACNRHDRQLGYEPGDEGNGPMIVRCTLTHTTDRNATHKVAA
jgi:hypothetical protein